MGLECNILTMIVLAVSVRLKKIVSMGKKVEVNLLDIENRVKMTYFYRFRTVFAAIYRFHNRRKKANKKLF